METFFTILERYWTTPEDTNPTMDAPPSSSIDTSGDAPSATMDAYGDAEISAPADTLPYGESNDEDLVMEGDSDVIMDVGETEQEPLKGESPQDAKHQNDMALESVEVMSTEERPSEPCAESPTVDPPMASVPGSSPVTQPSQEHAHHEGVSSPKKLIRGNAASSIVTPSDSAPMFLCQQMDPANQKQLVAARVARLRQGCLTKSLGSCYPLVVFSFSDFIYQLCVVLCCYVLFGFPIPEHAIILSTKYASPLRMELANRRWQAQHGPGASRFPCKWQGGILFLGFMLWWWLCWVIFVLRVPVFPVLF